MDFNENKCLKDLITTLKEEINFLRNEMDSKDKIIELVIKDKLNERAEKGYNPEKSSISYFFNSS